MMTQRSRKLLIVSINAVLGAAIMGTVALALWPVEIAASPQAQSWRTPTTSKTPGRAYRPSDAYAAIYQSDLRKPLFDPPATEATPIAKPAQPMPLRLIGTVMEKGFTYAVFKTLTGDTKTLGIGESLEGVEVVSVDATSATVRYAGQSSTMPVEKEEPK